MVVNLLECVNKIRLTHLRNSRQSVEVYENSEDRLEIKRRSWEARMTPNGKKESQVGP